MLLADPDGGVMAISDDDVAEGGAPPNGMGAKDAGGAVDGPEGGPVGGAPNVGMGGGGAPTDVGAVGGAPKLGNAPGGGTWLVGGGA